MSPSPITPRQVPATRPSPSHQAEAAGAAAQPARAAGDMISAPSKPASITLLEAARAQATAAIAPPNASRRSALVQALLAHVPTADRPAAKTAIPAILEAARQAGSSDPNRIGYLLATAQTESDFGANMTETGHTKQWFNAVYGCADGNRPGTSDGYAYRGRGYVQTTHAGRYAELSRRLGLPDVPALDHGKPVLDERGRPKMEPALIAQPERLTEPKLAAQALVIGVQKNLFTHNAAAALDTTIPTGKKPGAVDFYHARGIVNAIVKDQAQTIAGHATTYARILDSYRHSVLGVPAAK